MDFVPWLLGAIGLLLAVPLMALLGALLSAVRVEARVGPEGASGHGRWGVVGFEVEPGERLLVIRLFGLRLVRTPLRRDRAEPVEAKSGRAETRQRKRRRARLSLASYRRLAGTAFPEARRMLLHLHVDRLRIEAVIASDDPSWTGELYGWGCAVLGAARRAWPHAEVRLGADFTTTAPSGASELAVRFRPVRFVPGAARVGWAVWRERRRSLRRP